MSARSFIALVLLASGASACAPECRSGTLWVTLQFSSDLDLRQVDRLNAAVGANPVASATVAEGVVPGALVELDLGKDGSGKPSYRAGDAIDFFVMAMKGQIPLAAGQGNVILSGQCKHVPLTLSKVTLPDAIDVDRSRLDVTDQVIADGVAVAGIAVTVNDAQGDPLPGVAVTLSASGS